MLLTSRFHVQIVAEEPSSYVASSYKNGAMVKWYHTNLSS